MALDPDDVKKLDQHVVEPLLEAFNGLGTHIDDVSARVSEVNEGLGALRETVDGRFGVLIALHEQSTQELAGLRRIVAASSERQLASSERLNEIMRGWAMGSELRVADIDRRLEALETAWRDFLTKKNGDR